jgi:hypothetical protein
MINKRLKYISLAISVMILSIMVLSAGCSTGPSAAEYNAMKSELESIKADLASTKAELAALKTQAPASSTGSAELAKAGMYAEINDRVMDAYRVLNGQPSKYGYTANDIVKYVADLDVKVVAANDTTLTVLWKSYVTAAPGSADQFKKGVILLGYLSDKVKTLTAGK